MKDKGPEVRETALLGLEDIEEWDYDGLGLTLKFKNKKLIETEKLILE